MKCIGNRKLVVPINGYDDRICVYNIADGNYDISIIGKIDGWDKGWKFTVIAKTEDYIGLAYNNSNKLCLGWVTKDTLEQLRNEIANYGDIDSIPKLSKDILSKKVVNGIKFSKVDIQKANTSDTSTEIEKLKDDNEQLSKRIKELEEDNEKLRTMLKGLEEENKEIDTSNFNILAMISDGDIITVSSMVYDNFIRVVKSTFEMNRDCTKYKSLETLKQGEYCIVSLTEYTLQGENQRLNVLKKYVNEDADDIDIEQLKAKYEDWVKSRRQSFSV